MHEGNERDVAGYDRWVGDYHNRWWVYADKKVATQLVTTSTKPYIEFLEKP